MDLLEEYSAFAIGLAREAGKMIREADACSSTQRCVKGAKSSVADLVTETDENVENFIRTSIHTSYPDHKFIGEESTAGGDCDAGPCVLHTEPTWMVDPIDGTSNFVNQFPFYCVSIALWINKEASVAVIHNPVTQHMYHAVKGKGAFLNGAPIRVSPEKSLQNSLVLSNWGGDRNETRLNQKIGNFSRIIRASRGIRTLGSAALHICQVAQGCGEAFYEYGLHCWDYAAGILLVKEAGGVVLDTGGGAVDIMSRRVLCACCEEVARELVTHLQPVHYERD